MGKIGYGSVTLTDLTDALPLSLTLQANKIERVQTKIGNLYSPDFTKGEGLIITPSLFLGKENIALPFDESKYDGEIVYLINNKEIRAGVNLEEGITISDGSLIIKKNLSESITISARIENFVSKKDGYSNNVSSENSISIILIESSSNAYYATIGSEDGREYFKEESATPITLKAILYYGADMIPENDITYSWDALYDNDNEPKGDISGFESTFTVERAKISNLETFVCSMTQKSTGLTFSPSITIRDYTDSYYCRILADSSTILTPSNTKVILSNQVMYLTSILNEEESDRFSYSWSLLKQGDSNKTLLHEIGKGTKTLQIDLGQNVFPRENFTILGEVLIDEKTTVQNFIEIKYQPISYTIEISPKTFFIPAKNDGSLREKTFSKEFSFKLVDENKQPLLINSGDGLNYQKWADGSTLQVTSSAGNEWNYKCTFTLGSNSSLQSKDSSDSIIYDFNYTYLGNNFQEEIELVKNFAGVDGAQGFSGYTIELSNNFHAFSGEQGHATPKDETTSEITAYFGTEVLQIDKITANGETIFSKADSTHNDNFVNLNNLFVKAKQSGDKIVITFKAGEGPSFLTKIEPIILNITIIDTSGKEKTFVKVFSYTINYNGKSYFLNFSEGNIIKYVATRDRYEPESLSVSALYREVNGSSNAYDEGKIIYSFDNSEWNYLSADKRISGYRGCENIYVRLYSSAAGDDFIDDLDGVSHYLLDMETIPILTSMEGYEIGGENLIKWSKTMPVQSNRWNSDSTITMDTSSDFSEAIFNGSETEEWNILSSPKNQIFEELREKTFCLSFDFYCSDYSQFNSENYPLFIIAAAESSFSSKTRWGTIGNIKATEEDSTMIFSESPQPNKWIRVYQTFKLDENALDNSNSTSKLEDCKYYWIEFVGARASKFKIKKPKLELGNIPSSWSSSPYDIDYSDVIGVNLLSDIFYKKIALNEENNYTYLIADETIIKAETSYTLSFSSLLEETRKEKTLYLCFESEKEDESENIISQKEKIGEIKTSSQPFSFTFTTRNTVNSVVICNFDPENPTEHKEETYFVECLKLEEGTTPTPWSLTNQQVDQILSLGLQEISILDENGNPITFARNEDLLEYSETLNKIEEKVFSEGVGSISWLNSQYTTLSNSVSKIGEGDFGDVKILGKISKGLIDLGYDSVTSEPYLKLSHIGGGGETNFSMQLTSKSLDFFEKGERLASLSGFILDIPKLSSESITIGDLIFKKTSSGVGILWEEN